jgi:2-polyprenyl-6-methoxyphenol hydroxylase-like FAD-dependent oxidoreductase
MSGDEPILSVGAGPTGLMLACEQARRGARFCVVEQAMSPNPLSRAIAVHARTLETYASTGTCRAS